MTADVLSLETLAVQPSTIQAALVAIQRAQLLLGHATRGWRIDLGQNLPSSAIARIEGFDLAITGLTPPLFEQSLAASISALERTGGQRHGSGEGHAVTHYILTEHMDADVLRHLLSQMLATARVDPYAGLLRVSAVGAEGLGVASQQTETKPALLDVLQQARLSSVDHGIFASGKDDPSRHETLARFKDERGTTLRAAQVLTGQEPDAALAELDRAMLLRSVQRLVAEPTLRLSINVCRTTLHDPEWPVLLKDLVDRHPSAIARAVFEVTEWPIRAAHKPLKAALAPLAGLGLGWWLDDFGAGLTSFNETFIPSVTGLKVDRSLLRRCYADADQFGALKLVTSFARRQGKSCVIEGVESAKERDFAEACGASHVQGFFSGVV